MGNCLRSCPTARKRGKETGILPHYYFPWNDFLASFIAMRRCFVGDEYVAHCMTSRTTDSCATGYTIVPSFSLQWKSDESTKHCFTQMMLDINWLYWQSGKKPRMRMKVQGRFMQARFTEIHHIFANTKVGYFSNRVVSSEAAVPTSPSC
jgi:hypothetical protein